MSEEQRYVLGVAYQAGKDERIKRGQDGGRDYFTAGELEKAAWKFIKSRESGLMHVDGTEGSADVVESYIYRGPDWTVGQDAAGEDVVVKAGDWLVGAVLSPEAWELHKQGKITGWSPQGKAVRHPAKEE